MHYQTLRSVCDHRVFLICHDGEFYDLPEHIRR
jgi:hypothetical protein